MRDPDLAAHRVPLRYGGWSVGLAAGSLFVWGIVVALVYRLTTILPDFGAATTAVYGVISAVPALTVTATLATAIVLGVISIRKGVQGTGKPRATAAIALGFFGTVPAAIIGIFLLILFMPLMFGGSGPV